jgi:hypothetical protein
MAGENFRFWSDIESEPKRNNRWVFTFGGMPQWVVSKVSRPKFEVSNTEIPYINHTFNYPGRLKWKPISFTLRDPVHPDAAASIMEVLRASGYIYPKTPNERQVISRSKAIRAIGHPKIEMLDADGNTIEEWVFKNAWVSDADFGELDYGSEDPVDLVIQLTYDYAEIVKHGTVVPAVSG